MEKAGACPLPPAPQLTRGAYFRPVCGSTLVHRDAVRDIGRRGPMLNSMLLSFVDLKDPFTPGEIAGEPAPGPVLSILSAQPFAGVFLFHTPQTRENAETTVREIAERHPGCRVTLLPLPVSDPKD